MRGLERHWRGCRTLKNDEGEYTLLTLNTVAAAQVRINNDRIIERARPKLGYLRQPTVVIGTDLQLFLAAKASH